MIRARLRALYSSSLSDTREARCASMGSTISPSFSFSAIKLCGAVKDIRAPALGMRDCTWALAAASSSSSFTGIDAANCDLLAPHAVSRRPGTRSKHTAPAAPRGSAAGQPAHAQTLTCPARRMLQSLTWRPATRARRAGARHARGARRLSAAGGTRVRLETPAPQPPRPPVIRRRQQLEAPRRAPRPSEPRPCRAPTLPASGTQVNAVAKKSESSCLERKK